MLIAIEELLLKEMPYCLLVHGDTNTAFAGALTAEKSLTTKAFTGFDITVGHVESGLRSFDRNMPEEVNRFLIDHLSNFLFLPTKNGYTMITVIDYGMGNVGSVLNMIRRLGGDVQLSADVGEVQTAQKLILPGVGAFDSGMTALCNSGLDQAIHEAVVSNGGMITGICLGMQLLMQTSEEGVLPGLGLVPGHVHRFRVKDKGLLVPQMGWNVVRPTRPSTLFELSDEELRFYFVHSYYVSCDDANDIVGLTSYGHDYVSAVERDRILGVQFHPEKSHRFGMALLKRFVEV